MVENNGKLNHFLDEDGKIKSWPAKASNKIIVLEYLAEKFQWDVEYTEKEVNEIITQFHTFNDYFILRRELINKGLLCRTRDCSKYWKPRQ